MTKTTSNGLFWICHMGQAILVQAPLQKCRIKLTQQAQTSTTSNAATLRLLVVRLSSVGSKLCN